MKKIGLLLVVVVSLGAVGCSEEDEECAELVAKWKECCNRSSHETFRANCLGLTEVIEDAEECDARSFECFVTER